MQILQGCGLGWAIFNVFNILNKSHPEMRCGSCRSKENAKKTCFGQLTFIEKVIDFWVIHFIRVENFFTT
jgi:hypothetical protein